MRSTGNLYILLITTVRAYDIPSLTSKKLASTLATRRHPYVGLIMKKSGEILTFM